MTPLERRTPLRASRDHDWFVAPNTTHSRRLICERCHMHWFLLDPADDPPDGPCPGLKRSRISPVSQSNSGRDHQKDEAYREWIRRQPCVVCESEPPNDPHHRRSRGAGFGDWLEDGTGNLLPMCRVCHQTLHRKGVESFQYEQGINLEREAERIGERYREEEG